jgi:hypothetical protein
MTEILREVTIVEKESVTTISNPSSPKVQALLCMRQQIMRGPMDEIK